jgi:hypothetical protein
VWRAFRLLLTLYLAAGASSSSLSVRSARVNTRGFSGSFPLSAAEDDDEEEEEEDEGEAGPAPAATLLAAAETRAGGEPGRKPGEPR